MSTLPERTPMRPQLAWMAWILLATAIVPVCEAQDFWALAIFAGALSALGVWLSHRAGRPLLGQRITAAIALALGAVTALVSVDSGTIGVYAVANWLIALAILKCWQLGTSRDYAHVLIIVGLLLLVGSLVSWQLGFAIALGLAIILGPLAIIGWHLMAEQERRARLTGRANGMWSWHGHPGHECHGQDARATGTRLPWLTGRADHAKDPAAMPPRRSERLYGVSMATSILCTMVAFVVFATFPRLRTPLQPVVRSSAQQVMGFSAESRLNDIGRLQNSDRVVMRAQLSVGGQPVGGESLEPYFHGMSYNHYNGYGWENLGAASVTEVRLPEDASLVYFRQVGQSDIPGTIEQEYWVEAGPLPCLLALQTPVALGSQEIHHIQWSMDDDVLQSDARLPAVVHYKVRSVPTYLLNRAQTGESAVASPADSGAAATVASTQPAPTIYRPHLQPGTIDLARSLAAEVTDQADPPPALHEPIVGCFMRYLQSSQFTYSLDPPPRRRRSTPLEQFLAVKRGYCEYYATTLAVFCQSLGIPARYMTGFHGGKYNEVGGFYAVRDSDAHSWVEVWLPDRGWTAFDPTPARQAPTSATSLRAAMANLLDYLQFQWSNWVVAYDVLHRQNLLGTFDWTGSSRAQGEHTWTQFLWMFRELLAGPETLSWLGKLLYWLGLLGVLALSGYLAVQLLQQLLHRWRLHRQMRTARLAGIRFYERVISALAQRRLVRQHAETPREFAIRVEQALPQINGCFRDLIERYYAVRYGQDGRTIAGEQVAQEILRRLARAATDKRPSHEQVAVPANN